MRGKTWRRYIQIVPILVLAAALTFLIHYASGHNVELFNPAGPIAQKERNLILFALALSLIVVVPVFTMLFVFSWRYREGNTKATYSPELGGSRKAEAVWWLIPSLLIFVLSIVTWNSSHALDPYRPLTSSKAPLKIQVISLNWKWLFIYPDQNIATTNELYVPLNRPVDIELTSDATMNSFWLPQLAGQIYTMPGMETQLHLMASKTGTYRGQSANISGVGFAGMVFQTHVTSDSGFNDWVTRVRHSSDSLSQTVYNRLAEPTSNTPVFLYKSVMPDLFDATIHKYMGHDMMHMSMEES
ncbi:MAG: ubiquinol oxidase subunit II [Candidatus Saccharimonadales bacterium]